MTQIHIRVRRSVDPLETETHLKDRPGSWTDEMELIKAHDYIVRTFGSEKAIDLSFDDSTLNRDHIRSGTACEYIKSL